MEIQQALFYLLFLIVGYSFGRRIDIEKIKSGYYEFKKEHLIMEEEEAILPDDYENSRR